LAEQRAIADYLDNETERIDGLVGVLSEANDLLDSWLHSTVERVIWSGAGALVPLMRLTPDDRQIQYGIVLPGPDVPDGVPIVKGGDIVTGELGPSDLAKTTREIEAGYARSRLRTDDIVFAIRGAVGACAIVPPEVEGANITQDVARVAPAVGVDATWLLFALRSPSVQQQVGARIIGATIRGVNIRDLKRARVPATELADQRSQAAELMHAQTHRDRLVAIRRRQIALLRERRQALITAAVTGQLAVPGVAA
jgi:type I restriction enzyme S subunit